MAHLARFEGHQHNTAPGGRPGPLVSLLPVAMIAVGMLTEWLRPNDANWFAANQLGKAPCARPSAATDAVPLFGWDTIDGVLGSHRALDVLTVAAGELIAGVRPASREDVTRLMAAGVSVVVRAAELHDSGLARLADRFEQVLPGEVHVQLYV